MSYSQLPENEVGKLFETFLQFYRKKKILFILSYIPFVFYFSIPSLEIPFLKFSHIRVTSLMEERALQHRLLFFPRQQWVSINRVNPDLLKAIISIEDESFFINKGIDWKQVHESIRENERGGHIVRGASTITMQLAKNLFLSTNRNFFRKVKGIILAFRMEKELSKRTILQAYVNVVEWGKGIFGIKEASEFYFHKEPSNLTLNECVRLAAVIPSPLVHAPNQNTGYVLRRSSIIRGRMNYVKLDFGNSIE